MPVNNPTIIPNLLKTKNTNTSEKQKTKPPYPLIHSGNNNSKY